MVTGVNNLGIQSTYIPKPAASSKGEESKETEKKKKAEAPQESNYDPSFEANYPANYFNGNDPVFGLVLATLDQKWEIMEKMRKSFEPSEDEIQAEKQLDEKIAEKKRDLKKQIGKIVDKLEDIKTRLQSSLNPKGLLMELDSISIEISKIAEDVKGLNVPPAEKENMLQSVKELGKVVTDAIKVFG